MLTKLQISGSMFQIKLTVDLENKLQNGHIENLKTPIKLKYYHKKIKPYYFSLRHFVKHLVGNKRKTKIYLLFELPDSIIQMMKLKYNNLGLERIKNLSEWPIRK